jgi:polar amino acid transport system substrate-binding protein
MMAAMKFLPMLSLLVLSATSHSGELVFAVSSGSAMPMTRFEHQELTGGMLKGLGDALPLNSGSATRLRGTTR